MSKRHAVNWAENVVDEHHIKYYSASINCYAQENK
jgi:hypothetical protein